MWRTYCCLKLFFRFSICALVTKLQPDKFVRWCPDGEFVAIFLRAVFSASHVQHVSDPHLKFALRPHHVWKYGIHVKKENVFTSMLFNEQSNSRLSMTSWVVLQSRLAPCSDWCLVRCDKPSSDTCQRIMQRHAIDGRRVGTLLTRHIALETRQTITKINAKQKSTKMAKPKLRVQRGLTVRMLRRGTKR